MYTDVYVQYIHTYTVSIRQSTYHIQFCCIWYVHDRICIYMYVYVFLWAVFYLDCSSICMYIQFIHAYTDTVMGGTYVSICKYMYVFLSKIHAYTSSSIWTYFQQYIWQYICLYFQQYFLLYFSCTYTRPRCRHGCFAFAGACARSLPLRRAVAMASLSRGSASAGRLPHSIRSGLGDLYRRALAEVPWQSWLAVVHEVTAEQRRPSDTEMMRSLSNRQPPLRKRSWGFLNQLHTEIQAQKNNAND